MFSKYGIKTTFFIPGHSLETFPEECKMIAEQGHEIGLHGYSHENPRAMTLEQQTAVMDKVEATVELSMLCLANDCTVLPSHQRLPKRQASSRHRRTVVGVESRGR